MSAAADAVRGVPEARRPVPAWLWGGGLLVGSVVLQVGASPTVLGSVGGYVALTWAGRLVFAAALVIFAVGLRGRDSLVARRLPGLLSLLVLAGEPLIVGLVQLVVPVTVSDTAAASALGYVDLTVWVAAAILSVVEIGRAGVLPRLWAWAPAVGLAVVVGIFALVQVVGVALGERAMPDVALLLALGGFVTVLVPLTLGILAIALGARGVPVAPVQVFPPTR
jgi:hypothetical protein